MDQCIRLLVSPTAWLSSRVATSCFAPYESDGKEVFNVSSGAYTGASPALRGGAAFYGTFDNEVLGVNLGERKIAWRYEHPQRKFRFTRLRQLQPRGSYSGAATNWSMD